MKQKGKAASIKCYTLTDTRRNNESVISVTVGFFFAPLIFSTLDLIRWGNKERSTISLWSGKINENTIINVDDMYICRYIQMKVFVSISINTEKLTSPGHFQQFTQTESFLISWRIFIDVFSNFMDKIRPLILEQAAYVNA